MIGVQQLQFLIVILQHGNFFLHCFPNTGINTYKLKLYAKNADLDEEELEVALNYNVYNHIAVVKQDYNYSLFANGIKIGTVEWTTSYNSNTRIIFGSLTTYDSYYIHEYIDEIRFSDVARYTDSFDVPNAPYGQAVTDNRTLTELIEDLEEEKQLKVLPTNIRNQITILGVTGNLKPGIDTSDANAIASDIVQDKTAYVNGEKLTGTLTMFNYSFGDLAEQGYDLSGKSEEDPFVLTVDENGLNIAPKMPDRLSLESGSYFPVGVSNLDIAEEANITSDKIVQGNTIFGVVGTGGSTEYESLSNIGTSVNNESLLPESQFVTLSGTVNNTGIVTEDVTHFVAGTSYSSLANTIGLTADKLVEGETVLGIAGTAKVGSDIYKVFEDEEYNDYGNRVINLITSLDTIDINNKTKVNAFFRDCKNLENINQILNTSSTTDMNSMFSGCTSLTTIPLFDTSGATNMNRMFGGCTSLTTIPQLNTSSVTNMNSMFIGCTSLTSIPALNTSSVTTMEYTFQNCTSLVTVPLFDTSSVTSMRYMFKDCIGLISIPQLNTSSTTNMDRMFEGCSSLTTIPVLNTNEVTGMSDMFNGCTSLTDDSLNNILQMCINAVSISSTPNTLQAIGLTEAQAATCTTLSNYQAFLDAGWTTGY